MTPEHPYFPPPLHNVTTIWRKKSQLVMTKQAVLPYRCVKCNARADTLLKRNLRWHHPALYLVALVGALFYVILAMVISKSATVNVGLCKDHASARKRDLVITWALVLLSFACFYLAAVAEDVNLLLVGVVMLLGSAIYGVVKTRVVAPQKIDDHFVWLSGVNGNYLDEFPEWRGAA